MKKNLLLLLSIIWQTIAIAQVDNEYKGLSSTQQIPVIESYASFPSSNDFINQLLNNACNYTIPIIEQSSSQFVLTDLEQCFKHDAAGNMDINNTCPTLGKKTIYSSKEETINLSESLDTHVRVYPNPTSSIVTISWDNEINELISSMRIVAMNGAYDSKVSTNIVGYTYNINLTPQPNGIYVLVVTLKTGQTISKNIIKL